MSKKIVIAVGSFRKGSFNQSFADYVKVSLEAAGATAEFLDYRDVPLLEQDTEFPTPSSVEKVRDQVASADGVWVVSPEYNGSYPAVLKNVFDWLSRPVKPFDFETPTVLNGKAATFSGAAGSTEAKFVREQLKGYLPYIRMNVLPGEGLGLQIPAEAWQTGVFELSAEQKSAVDAQVAEFLEFIK